MCPLVTPPRRCRLAEVCSTFRTLFAAQAFAGRPMRLDLNSLSWRLAERKKKAAARGELRAAVARYAPSVTHLCLKYMLDGCAGISLRALLAPLAPHVRVLEVDDGLCMALLDALSLRLETTACGGSGGKNKAGKSGGGRGGARVGSGSGGAGSGDGTWAWASLQEVSFTGCNLWIGGWRGRVQGGPELYVIRQWLAVCSTAWTLWWHPQPVLQLLRPRRAPDNSLLEHHLCTADLQADQLAALERQLAALPELTSKVARFECCEPEEWFRGASGGWLADGLFYDRHSSHKVH